MPIHPILARTALTLSAMLSVTPALSQGVGSGIYDLTLYTEQAQFGAWRVHCTADGVASRPDQARDCLLEEDSGFLIFTYSGGYFALGLRDAAPGDTAYGRDLAVEPRGVVLTFFGPGFTEQHLDDMGVSRGGVPVALDAAGYAAAEAEALRLIAGSEAAN